MRGKFLTIEGTEGVGKTTNIEFIKQWLDVGMDIGAHTQTHPDLTVISLENAEKEINYCKSELEKKFNIKINDFCYPYGRFNDSIINILKKTSFKSATTMRRGRVNKGSDIFMLPRIPITYRTLPHLFLAKILTKYEDKRQA